MKKASFNNIFPAFIPEILLISGALFCLLGDLIYTSTLNFFILTSMLVLFALTLWKNKYLALIISVLLGLSGFYLIFAVLSEFSEFPAGNIEGIIMLITGLVIFGSLILLSFVMPRKYLKK